MSAVSQKKKTPLFRVRVVHVGVFVLNSFSFSREDISLITNKLYSCQEKVFRRRTEKLFTKYKKQTRARSNWNRVYDRNKYRDSHTRKALKQARPQDDFTFILIFFLLISILLCQNYFYTGARWHQRRANLLIVTYRSCVLRNGVSDCNARFYNKLNETAFLLYLLTDKFLLQAVARGTRVSGGDLREVSRRYQLTNQIGDIRQTDQSELRRFVRG